MPQAPRQRNSFALSVVAAFALNGLAIGAFAAAVARWQAPADASGTTSWITAVALPPPALERSEVVAPARLSPAVDSTPAHPAVAPPLQRLEVAPPVAPPSAGEANNPVRFYRSSEVDRPAEPDSDWNLDTAVLDAAGVETLVFEIFIDRDGRVVGCRVLEPATLDTAARQMLEQRLRETALQPAMRGGAAVASVRRIEVSALPPTP